MKSQKYALMSAWVAMIWLSGLVPPVWAQAQPTPNLALKEYVTDLLTEHPVLGKARAELQAAEARARGQARSLYNPEVEFGYENALDKTREVGLSQTLDLSGKRRARKSVATSAVAAAMARFTLANNTLIADTLITLAEYQARHDSLRIAQSRVKLDEEFLLLAERRNRAGDLPQSDLLTARLTLAEARAEANSAGLEFSRAEERLLAAAGSRQLSPPLMIGIPPQAPPSVDSVALEELPQLLLAKAETEAARSSIRVAKRNRIPDPTLGFSIGDQRAITSFGERESTTLVGARLSIPLPVFNSYSAEVEAAGADLIAADQNMFAIKRRVEARLFTSHRRYQLASNAWRNWTSQGAVPLEEQRALLQRLWQAGEINAIDYIIQLNQTFATESAGVELRGRLWTTWFDWLDASGSISAWMENSQ